MLRSGLWDASARSTSCVFLSRYLLHWKCVWDLHAEKNEAMPIKCFLKESQHHLNESPDDDIMFYRWLYLFLDLLQTYWWWFEANISNLGSSLMLSVIYLSLFFPLTTTETSLLVTKCLMLQYKISSYWLLCETQHGFILWVFEFEWFIGEYLVANVSENSQVQKYTLLQALGQ